LQKYILFPQSFGVPDAALPPPVVVPTNAQARPVLAHLHVGHQGKVHPAQQAAAAAAVRAHEGVDAPAVDADLAADKISEEGEEEEEQQDIKVEQEEQQAEEEEVKELQEPQTMEELQAKLAEAQHRLQQYAGAEGDNDVIETVHTSSRLSARDGGWGSIGLVVVLSVLMGVSLGAAAMHFLTSRAGGTRYARVGQTHQNGVHHGAGQQNGQSIDEMLRVDDLEASLERNRLLNAGPRAS
jgi:hypothetical protein